MTHRVIVHCGLHKTGTSALQQFLLQAAEPLRALGVLVPRAGRLPDYGGGHHNIAWELTRDRRFDRTRGGVAELAEEIADFDGDAVLSSEDFESCFAVPGRLAPLLHHPKLQDRKVILAIYLRDQISYAEGLFMENILHGCAEECLQVMQEILANGELKLREWRFQFDYARLHKAAAALAPTPVVYYSYAALDARGIAPQFMARFFPGVTIADWPGATARVNVRRGLLPSLRLFQSNRVNRHLDKRELAAVHLLAAQAPSAALALPRRLRRALADRFAAGNVDLCRAAGLPPALLDLSAHVEPPQASLYLDWVFSFESQIAIAALAALLPSDMDLDTPDPGLLPAAGRSIVQGVVTAWRSERPAV